MDLFIDFEWRKDPAGYDLVAEEPTNPDPELTLLERYGRPQRVVPRSEPAGWSAFRPFRGPYKPYIEFAKVRTPDDLLNFVRRFGPLTEHGLSLLGEEVPYALQHAEAFRSWCVSNVSKASRKKVLDLMSAKSVVFARLEASIIIDEHGKIRLSVLPKSLLVALWLQLVEALSGTTISSCQFCGAPFETGPGKGRRLNSKYCSKDHHALANSLKRSSRFRSKDA
jgi:hypothetical protein